MHRRNRLFDACEEQCKRCLYAYRQSDMELLPCGLEEHLFVKIMRSITKICLLLLVKQNPNMKCDQNSMTWIYLEIVDVNTANIRAHVYPSLALSMAPVERNRRRICQACVPYDGETGTFFLWSNYKSIKKALAHTPKKKFEVAPMHIFCDLSGSVQSIIYIAFTLCLVAQTEPILYHLVIILSVNTTLVTIHTFTT